MTTKDLENLERTLEKTNVWLKKIAEELGRDDRHLAYQALRATLHALRDRMAVDDVAHLGAQLPMLVRGIFYEGWKPAGKPLQIRDQEDFLDLVRGELWGLAESDAARAVQAVFRTLEEHVTAGEIEHVKHALPRRIRELWPPS